VAKGGRPEVSKQSSIIPITDPDTLVRLNRELRENESRFRQLASVLPQIVWTATPAGECDFLCRKWEEYTGIPAEAQLGSGWLDQVHPDDRAAVMVAWANTVSSGAPFQLDFRIRRHDGVFRMFDTRALPLYDEAGAITKWFGTNTDIQEQVEMRLALEATEQRFQNIYNSAPVSIWQMDWQESIRMIRELQSEGVTDFVAHLSEHPKDVERLMGGIRMIDFNDWTLRIFKAQTKPQLLEAIPKVFERADDLPTFAGQVQALADGQAEHCMEMTANALDGTRVHLQVTAALPARDSNSTIVIVSVVDISDRVRAATESQRRQALLDRTNGLAQVGGWEFDVETMEGSWTEEVAYMYEVDPAAPPNVALGLSAYVGESRLEIERAVTEAIQEAKPYDLELEMRLPSGTTRWVRTQGEPVVRGGRVVKVEGAIQDISKRKRAELALRELNANLEQQVATRTAELKLAHRDLKNILDAMPSMVGYWDKDLFNRFANHAYKYWFGFEEKDIPGRHIREIIGEDLYQLNLPHIEAALGGEAQVFECPIPDPNGSRTMQAMVHYIPDDQDGEVRGFYVVVHDITAFKLAETALTAANEELQAFSSAVAHDLRAPLRSLNGFSQVLIEDFGDQLPGEAHQSLQAIKRSSRKMSDIVDGLLTLSRSVQDEPVRQQIDMSALVENIRHQISRSGPDHHVEWEIEPGLTVFGDPRMVETVLTNLLENAWKYTGRTENPKIRFYAEPVGRATRFCVSDNGAGFNMQFRDKLFKPFQRLHREDEFTGIGIGLATVLRIVHRHGGTLEAEGQLGKGATFSFTLEPG